MMSIKNMRDIDCITFLHSKTEISLFKIVLKASFQILIFIILALYIVPSVSKDGNDSLIKLGALHKK